MALTRAKKKMLKTYAIIAAAVLVLYWLAFKTSAGQGLVAKIKDTITPPQNVA